MGQAVQSSIDYAYMLFFYGHLMKNYGRVLFMNRNQLCREINNSLESINKRSTSANITS